MGNWFGKKRVVHPLEAYCDVEGARRSNTRSSVIQYYSEKSCNSSSSSSSRARIKVRMTKTEMEEMIALANQDDHDHNQGALGRLIFQQCLEGRWRARVDTTYPADCPLDSFTSGRCLRTIIEEQTPSS